MSQRHIWSFYVSQILPLGLHQFNIRKDTYGAFNVRQILPLGLQQFNVTKDTYGALFSMNSTFGERTFNVTKLL